MVLKKRVNFPESMFKIFKKFKHYIFKKPGLGPASFFNCFYEDFMIIVIASISIARV